MAVKVGMNGFGCMGRLGLRAGWGNAAFRIAQRNEIATDATGSAHLLTFDSVHGRWMRDCRGSHNRRVVAGHP